MNITNNSNIHLSFAVWLLADNYDYDSRSNAISATKLLDSTRQIILGNRAKQTEQTEGYDLENLIPSGLGNAIHDSTELAWKNHATSALIKMGKSNLAKRIKINPDPSKLTKSDIPVYLEQRTEKELDGYIVTGKYDAIMDGQIIDYKSTGCFTYMNLASNEKKYILQESIYRWLNQDKVTSDIGLINFIFTDWSKLQAMVQEKRGYPQSRLITHEITLLSLDDTETYIRKKIAQIKRYMGADDESIPECTKEELWQSDSKFAYYKNPTKRSRATKVFDSYAEAQTKLISDGSVGEIVERVGTVKRCLFCKAINECLQAKRLIEAEKLII